MSISGCIGSISICSRVLGCPGEQLHLDALPTQMHPVQHEIQPPQSGAQCDPLIQLIHVHDCSHDCRLASHTWVLPYRMAPELFPLPPGAVATAAHQHSEDRVTEKVGDMDADTAQPGGLAYQQGAARQRACSRHTSHPVLI